MAIITCSIVIKRRATCTWRWRRGRSHLLLHPRGDHHGGDRGGPAGVRLRYHWQQRSTGLRGLGLLVLLALPLVRFMINHPDEYVNRLKMYNSFWVADMPLPSKIGLYFSTYLAARNPFYWFLPNSKDIIRYVMQGYGHIALPMLPFAAIGLVMAIRRLRLSENRLLVVMLLAAPTGGAMVGMNVTRARSRSSSRS